MVIPRESIVEDGFLEVMGGFGYGVHYHGNLFDTGEWGTKRLDNSVKGFKARGPFLTISLSVLCGRPQCYFSEGSGGW